MLIEKMAIDIDKNALVNYKTEVEKEWKNILDYWIEFTVDDTQGGFFGSVSNNNIADAYAPKGVVLCSRILWAFSAAYFNLRDAKYLAIAKRAYEYLLNNFIDKEFGGVYWSLDHTGKVLDDKKQIYGIAFCIYGLSEYYKATRKSMALEISKQLMEAIELYSYDKINGGYLEAFTRNWEVNSDLRLSEKDDNEMKTMNTHLHIIEAYANLFTVYPERKLCKKIADLLNDFENHFIDKKSFHLNLFFDEQWLKKSTLISFGHDIEAAWLLLDCAEKIGNQEKIEKYKSLSNQIASAATKGLDADGGLWYEYDSYKEHWIKEKHNWPQAEAMVGFINAFEITGNASYLLYSFESWAFIKNNLIDKKFGEWFWGINEDKSLMENQDKAGFWKCPYHNTRACLEISKRIQKLLN